MEPGLLVLTLLQQADPVTAIVGTRIYPLVIPQGKPRPALTFQLIGLANDSISACLLDDVARVQVNVFTDDYETLCDLSQAVRDALAGYDNGTVSIEFANAIDHRDDPTACFFRSVDFRIE